jgi:hypothetical protein
MNAQPNQPKPIFLNPLLPVSEYITAGSLPRWEQMPPACQQELIHTLASLLMGLPEVRGLTGSARSLEATDERQP